MIPTIPIDPTMIAIIIVAFIVGVFFLSGIKIIRPTHVAAIETLGKYKYFKRSGITYVIPLVQKNLQSKYYGSS